MSTSTGMGVPLPFQFSTSTVTVPPAGLTTVPFRVSSPSLLDLVISIVKFMSPSPLTPKVASPLTMSTAISTEETPSAALNVSVTASWLPDFVSWLTVTTPSMAFPGVNPTVVPSPDTSSWWVTPLSPCRNVVSAVAANPGPLTIAPADPPSVRPVMVTETSPCGTSMTGGIGSAQGSRLKVGSTRASGISLTQRPLISPAFSPVGDSTETSALPKPKT